MAPYDGWLSFHLDQFNTCQRHHLTAGAGTLNTMPIFNKTSFVFANMFWLRLPVDALSLHLAKRKFSTLSGPLECYMVTRSNSSLPMDACWNFSCSQSTWDIVSSVPWFRAQPWILGERLHWMDDTQSRLKVISSESHFLAPVGVWDTTI